jgi:nucleoside-diphosphate-sugar epimerase
LGHGYSAQALARLVQAEGWHVMGSHRDPERADILRAQGVEPILWDRPALEAALARADHVLVSAGPGNQGDPSLPLLRDALSAQASTLRWVGYLSTTGVYGDHDGAWVDETTPLTPSTKRGKARVAAEQDWQSIPDLPLHIFRLAGIYGPGRGPFSKVRNGTARRILKPGQVFSRIHIDDIAQVLFASIQKPRPGGIYNVCDDDPAPPQDVLSLAADLLNMPAPPAVDFDKADLGPMARSFYAENKRVSNGLLASELGVTLKYPSYTSGLPALLDS